MNIQIHILLSEVSLSCCFGTSDQFPFALQSAFSLNCQHTLPPLGRYVSLSHTPSVHHFTCSQRICVWQPLLSSFHRQTEGGHDWSAHSRCHRIGDYLGTWVCVVCQWPDIDVCCSATEHECLMQWSQIKKKSLFVYSGWKELLSVNVAIDQSGVVFWLPSNSNFEKKTLESTDFCQESNFPTYCDLHP